MKIITIEEHLGGVPISQAVAKIGNQAENPKVK